MYKRQGFSIYNRLYKYVDYNAKGQGVAQYDKRRKGWNITWGRVSDEYRTNYLNIESTKDSIDFKSFAVLSGLEEAALEAQKKWMESHKEPKDEDEHKQWEIDKKKVASDKIAESEEAIRKSTGRTNSITFTHVYDSRDNFFNATKGKRISVSAQWGGHGLGGDFDFYKVSGEGRFYKGLRNGHTLALRVMGGYIHGNIAYGNLFSLGGSNTLRGYEDEQFKGKKMYAATLEYRFPIAKKIQGVVFTDVGSAWDVGGSMPWYVDSKSINYAYGVGVRLQTPIGPIRLDYGHGDQNKFHFSFGTQF